MVVTLMDLFLMEAIIMIFLYLFKIFECNHSARKSNMLENTRTYTLERST